MRLSVNQPRTHELLTRYYMNLYKFITCSQRASSLQAAILFSFPSRAQLWNGSLANQEWKPGNRINA